MFIDMAAIYINFQELIIEYHIFFSNLLCTERDTTIKIPGVPKS